MNIKDFFTHDEYEILNVDYMNSQQTEVLQSWLLRMMNLLQPEQGEITRIKYDGKLLQLTNGKKYEIDDYDALTSDMWSEGDSVIVLDGKMYNLESADSVDCQEESW